MSPLDPPFVLRCHPGIGAPLTGTVLVAADGFSARYDLDRKQGVFSRPAHKLHGQAYHGMILALNTSKGGVATAWMLHEMAARGIVPAALLFNRVNPIIAQGAAFGGIVLMDRFEGDVTTLLHMHDRVRLDPAQGQVTILERQE